MKNIFNILIVLLVVISLTIPGWYYFDLPSTIPGKFSAIGDSQKYVHKATIWLFPIMGLFFCLLIFFLKRLLIDKKTGKVILNAPPFSSELLTILVLLGFSLATYKEIQSAMGKSTSSVAWTQPVIIIVMICSLIFLIYQQRKLETKG